MALTDYLPTAGERGGYTGPFSTFAEYHAFGVGLLYLADPSLVGEIVAYGMGSGTGKAKRSGHYRDAAKEVAYVGGGILLALAARALGLAP